MVEWGQIIVATCVALFPIVDPIGAIPTFVVVTEGDSEDRKTQQLKKACLYVFCMLAVFLIAGNLIMAFFGISIPGIRIAGGIILFRVGQNLLQARPKYTQSQEEQTESVSKQDVSFTPLAMPILSGPGAIAVTLGLTSSTNYWYDYIAIILGIGLVVLATWLILKAATKVTKFLGVTGMNIIERMMGFLILCISVQFIINGVLNTITDERVLRKIFALL